MYVNRHLTAVVTAGALWLQSCVAQAGAASCSNITSGQTYDYIIVGSGAGGIPMADRLSEAGHSVLLIEKGPPSTGRWGGTMKPTWLNGTSLTRFDVPGLCNQIWHDPVGIACTDVDQMAGCVLGGGTAVNAGLWWKPHPADWDTNFPDGWKNQDLVSATDRVFSRIPGTTAPSMDGKLYLPQGFDMLGGSLAKAGWKYIVPNDHPDQKNRTYGHSTFMYSGGERGGPLATYLVTASSRKTFTLWTNTMAKRVVRVGGHVTGVEVECNGGGYAGAVSVTPTTGRVILAAGAFGSAKLLFRSGIGPADQLNIVKNTTDGPTMLSSDAWIDLPVGYNLNDHVGTDIEISHPDVVFYDYYGAWNKPIVSDTETYLSNRTGPLAQAAPNINPMFWEIINGSDGILRHLHWQSRVEGTGNTSMTITQYLGTGSVSRGRMTITRQLNTVVSIPPYLHDDNDKAAVVKGLENLQESLKTVPNLTWITPKPNITAAQFVNSIPATPARRCSNHWIGTARIGTDDGRTGGKSVVDLNTKVYGTDNLFVVDASIFPGHVTSNPSAAIVIASEHAASKILALPAPSAGKVGATCGGRDWKGSFHCEAGLGCRAGTNGISQCTARS
ncbi:cellobiose dehydrogenase [Diplogelasinospora grovesii]|uniref:Cellobiose dehydrogenase n=1 Tax=Diplogelasinospora grovesii TaxID=303347 RepID=A0AAN6NFB0_9PEZI|nr:cellobiose dehydrogenase [Diplogelasinospora grovesii]